MLRVAGDVGLGEVSADIVTIEGRKGKVVNGNSIAVVTRYHIVTFKACSGRRFKPHPI